KIQIGTWPGSVTETVVLTYGNNLAPTGTNSTALLAASSFFSNAVTAGVNTATVGSGFVSFSTTTNTATTTYTARVGKIYLKINDNSVSTGAPASNYGLFTYTTAITISVAGTPLAASVNSAVFITSAGG